MFWSRWLVRIQLLKYFLIKLVACKFKYTDDLHILLPWLEKSPKKFQLSTIKLMIFREFGTDFFLEFIFCQLTLESTYCDANYVIYIIVTIFRTTNWFLPNRFPVKYTFPFPFSHFNVKSNSVTQISVSKKILLVSYSLSKSHVFFSLDWK